MPTGRLVAGLHSGGTVSPTACGTFSLDVSTWNLLYTLEGQTVVGQNGDFIRRSLTDFDRDLIPDDYDNCPNVANFGQANCNAIAEDAKGYERRGDACDPRPCAHGRIEPAEKLVSAWSGGSLILEQHGVMVRRDFEVDPRPSMPYYNGANDGEDGAGIATNASTKYRFCQEDEDKDVDCEDDTTVDNGLVDLPDGVIGPQRPFLRMAVWDPANPAPAEDNETLSYDGASQAVRRWDYKAHHNLWSNQSPPWISPVGTTGLFGTTTGLSGRLWVHSATNIGLFATGSATGYRVSTAGTTLGESELGNYYVPYAGQSVLRLRRGGVVARRLLRVGDAVGSMGYARREVGRRHARGGDDYPRLRGALRAYPTRWRRSRRRRGARDWAQVADGPKRCLGSGRGSEPLAGPQGRSRFTARRRLQERWHGRLRRRVARQWRSGQRGRRRAAKHRPVRGTERAHRFRAGIQPGRRSRIRGRRRGERRDDQGDLVPQRRDDGRRLDPHRSRWWLRPGARQGCHVEPSRAEAMGARSRGHRGPACARAPVDRARRDPAFMDVDRRLRPALDAPGARRIGDVVRIELLPQPPRRGGLRRGADDGVGRGVARELPGARVGLRQAALPAPTSIRRG